ncbi:MAG: hypothetical protein Q7W44_04830, partial [Coriobacteriia bacterium]|nr:hypothetical protein [Coriobacteriia bacterium]
AAIAAGELACTACHGEDAGDHLALHDSALSPFCATCHEPNLVDEHDGYDCATCHGSTDPAVVAAIAAGELECLACHGEDAGDHLALHDSDLSAFCADCHEPNLIDEHDGYDCAACHSSTEQDVVDAIAAGDLACTACHDADAGDHLALHDSTLDPACAACHEPNLVDEHEGLDCATCHGSTDPTVVAAIAAGELACTACHDLAEHPYVVELHTATVGAEQISGTLIDELGVPFTRYDGSTQTYGGQTCGACHSMDLAEEHTKPSSSVAADGCAACHPSPRDEFETWDGTCLQSGCHAAATLHDDMPLKHSWSAWSTSGQAATCGYVSSGSGRGCHVGEWTLDLAAVHEEATHFGTVFVDTSGYPDGCAFCHSSNTAVPVTPTACTDCHGSAGSRHNPVPLP